MRPLLLFVLGIGGCIASKPGLLMSILPHQNALDVLPPAAPAISAANPTTICSDQLLNYCRVRFDEHLNITTEDWRNFDQFVTDVLNILNQGVDNGLLKLCAARTQYYGCLGASYDDCMSRFHFLKQGRTLAEATEYVEIFAQLEFMCDGGLLQTVRGWDCIWQTAANFTTYLDGCRAAFINVTRADPKKYCDASQTFMMCVRTPFLTRCGADASWWECELNRVGLEIVSYCPQLSCLYSIIPPSSVQTSRYSLFRSPNPYFMPKYKQELYASLAGKAIERAKRKKRSVE